MFTGKAEYDELRCLMNALNLELYECAEAAFDWSGENGYSFNRLFAVAESSGVESKITLTTNGTERIMKRGCVYFLSAGDRFRFDFHRGTHFFSFHFNLRLFGQELFLQTGRLEEIPDRGRWVYRIGQLLKTGNSPRRAGLLNAQITAEAAGLLPPGESLNYTLFLRDRQLLQYLWTRADARTTLADLAELTGLTPDTLSRRFSHDYHVPLKRRLTYAVAARAEHLLQNRNLKIREVACILRFRDEFYFSKFFKRETGLTPSEFRRSGKI